MLPPALAAFSPTKSLLSQSLRWFIAATPSFAVTVTPSWNTFGIRTSFKWIHPNALLFDSHVSRVIGITSHYSQRWMYLLRKHDTFIVPDWPNFIIDPFQVGVLKQKMFMLLDTNENPSFILPLLFSPLKAGNSCKPKITWLRCHWRPLNYFTDSPFSGSWCSGAPLFFLVSSSRLILVEKPVVMLKLDKETITTPGSSSAAPALMYRELR